MTGFWLVCAIGVGLVAVVAALYVGLRLGTSSAQPELYELRRSSATDRNLILTIVRRELANFMFHRDPVRYIDLYRKTHEEVAAIKTAERKDQFAELSKLTTRYKFYQDFDLLQVRDHVLYADAFNSHTVEEIEAHYVDIIHFQALMHALDEQWWDAHATTDSDLQHAEEYLPQVKDTLFQNRLKAAVREYRAHRSLADLEEYETATFVMKYVPHFAENRYGIHFKDTNEFGLYTVFTDDNGKAYTNFFRSSADFKDEVVLDDIPSMSDSKWA